MENPMAPEQDNAAVVRRFFERVWKAGDLSAIEDLVDDQFTNQLGLVSGTEPVTETSWRAR